MFFSFNRRVAQFLDGHPQLHHWLLGSGVIPGSIDYTRFIILGRSRTGSNFLRGLLTSRSDVLVLGEILKNPDQIEWGTEGFPQAAGVERDYRRAPAEFLERHVFRKLPNRIDALGFKLFYYHSREENRLSTWQYLQDNTDLRVIHIKRHNILKTFLSWARANQNGQWVAQSAPERKSRPLELSYEDCLKEFEQTRRWELEGEEFFAGHPILELYYEDLASDYQGVMKRVQKFLELDVKPVSPQTYKQASLPLDQAIANYEDLKNKFEGTEWQGFFESA